MTEQVSDLSARMRASLAISEPDLDTGIGSPVRKIIDAVAEVGAELSVESYLMSYAYDIDAKAGADLDSFVGLFGLSRIQARRASGTLTFQRQTAAISDILVLPGTQVATPGFPNIVAQTVVPAVLNAGTNSLDIPAQTILAGQAANVSANALTIPVNVVGGIESVTNVTSFTGGSNAESDELLRIRFKRTVFRSLAGTEDQFLATALNHPDVTRANVVGSSKVHREQIAIASGTGTSSITDAAYIYADAVFFGPSIDGGDIFKEAVHYSFATSNPPVVTVLSSGVVPDGVYELEFRYASVASRNDPANGVSNRIDVWVAGSDVKSATETVVWNNALVFNNTGGSPYKRTNYQRLDGTNPVNGNIFMPLTFGPITSIPTSIVWSGQTYTIADGDYWLVHDTTVNGLSGKSLFGIEWKAAANGQAQSLPSNGSTHSLNYSYNDVPTAVEIALRQWRLVTTDVRVHQAKLVRLNLHLAIIYSPGVSPSSVQTEVTSAVSTFINSVDFGQVVQVSDLLRVVSSVNGVDAVRFLTTTDDATHYAIQSMASDGTTIIQTYDNNGTPKRAIDVLIGDDDVPILNSIVFVQKAQNNFGAV